MKYLLVGLIIPIISFANLEKAPKNFKLKSGNMAVFIDIETIDTKIEYDLDTKKATSVSRIAFNNLTSGHPIFDLKQDIQSIHIDDQKTQLISIEAPDRETNYKSISEVINSGKHILVITNEITTNIDFNQDYVSSAFWMSDLSDRKYLEQYIPTNLEFDQFELNLDVKIISSSKIETHEIFTNGEVLLDDGANFSIKFPAYFTSSSHFFHLTKKDKFAKKEFSYTDQNGRVIPITVYTRYSWFLKSAVEKTLEVMKELENRFGVWPHPSLTIYVAGQGGMEYSGATMTSLSALGHELTHSYFARGVMPINGNSGWIDEAIASWRDSKYASKRNLPFGGASMSSHSSYRRYTDRDAYSHGRDFLKYINYRLDAMGGLSEFLKGFHTKYTHTNISTDFFKISLEAFAGEDFSKEFDQHIYGKKKFTKSFKENPNHPILSKKDLLKLL